MAIIQLQAVGPGRKAREFNEKINDAHKRLFAAEYEPQKVGKVLEQLFSETKAWEIPPRPSAQAYMGGFLKYLDSREENIAQNPSEIYDSTRRHLENLQILHKVFSEDHIAQMMFSNSWSYLSAALNFLVGLALFAGGIGLFLHEAWGWRIVLVVAAAQVIHLLTAFVLLLTSTAFEQIAAAASKHNSAFLFVVVSAAAILVWFFLLTEIVVLTRINVRRFFRRSRRTA